MRRRVALMLLAMSIVVVACGVADEGAVQRVGPDDIPFDLDETIPTTTSTTTTIPLITTTSDLATTTTAIPTEEVRLYFIVGRRLTFVRIPLPSPSALGQVVFALQTGPPAGDLGLGLRSALPDPSIEILVTEDGSGVASVDLPVGFFDAISIGDQRLAIAQIVLTLTERPRIGQVTFTQAGEPLSVPRGNGELADPGAPLAFRDYESLLTDAVVVLNQTTTIPSTVTPLSSPEATPTS